MCPVLSRNVSYKLANSVQVCIQNLSVTAAQGVRATAACPNPYLFQSLAVLAADMGRTEEARKWFHKGSSTLMVSVQQCCR